MRLYLAASVAAILQAATASQLSGKQCVTTIGLPGGCCPPASASSETILVDCAGCSLTSVTTGIHCMMICPTPAPTSPGTTTVTSCSPSKAEETSATASASAPSVEAPINAGPGFVECIKTITTTEPWQCTVTVPKHTKTYSSDCSCCDLTTTTLPPSVNARCRHPQTTVFNRRKTKTETVCATSTSCSIYW